MLSSHILCAEHSNIALKSELFEKLSCKVLRQSFGAVKSIGLGILTRRALMPLSQANIVFGVSTRAIPYNAQPFVADTSTLPLHGRVCICVMS